MSESSRLSRGDKRRNARIARLQEIVKPGYGILAVDLASKKQACVVTHHDSRVVARKTFQCAVWEFGEVLQWGRAEALAAGFTGVVVACEPTGHRWRVVQELAIDAGLELVCVQPMLVARARVSEDLTTDKTDNKDAVLIALLAGRGEAYVPEQPTPQWARLRHLGARRASQITRAGAAAAQVRDLLECCWPAALRAAGRPMDSATWLAAMTVIDCDPARARRLGVRRLLSAVAAEMPYWGASRPNHRIVTAIHAAGLERTGVADQRPGSLERARLALGDLQRARAERDAVHTRMAEVIEELGYTELIASIPGVSVISAAAILAETGDPTRYTSARALVKHAGLCPREHSSGTHIGTSAISGRGRPRLRLAAWRAVFGAVRHNEVLAARYHYLTHRDKNRLTTQQARVAVAGSLLRQLHAVLTTGTPWNPDLAAPRQQDHLTTTRSAA